jgi:hypothetical protein
MTVLVIPAVRAGTQRLVEPPKELASAIGEGYLERIYGRWVSLRSERS